MKLLSEYDFDLMLKEIADIRARATFTEVEMARLRQIRQMALDHKKTIQRMHLHLVKDSAS
jgi:hypothetical protein